MNHSSRAVFLGIALSCAATRAFAGCQPLWDTSSPATSVPGLGSAAMADFDGDGVSDLALIRPTLAVVLITDETAKKPGPAVTVAQGTNFTDVETADVNGDGKADLLLADSGTNGVSVLPGNGNGTFGTPVTTVFDVPPTELAIADFNSDGKPDLAIRSTPAAMIIAAGNGSGQFTELHRTTLPDGALFPVAGDFNGDAKADLLLLQWNITSLQLIRGNGDGTLAAPTPINLSYTTQRYKAADLDADGDLDIALYHQATDRLAILRNDGTGAFTPFGEYNTRPSSYGDVFDIAAADVTQDGVVDLVLALPNDRAFGTLTGKGDGTFEPARFTLATVNGLGALPSKLFLSDVNGDERPDVLFLTSRDAAIGTNRCGDTAISPTVVTPLVSVGQTAVVETTVFSASPTHTHSSWPQPTGTVTIYEDSTPVATGDAGQYPPQQIEIEGLSAGTHTLRAVYGGDDHYHEAESGTFTVRVTTDTTSTTVVPKKTTYTYGEPVSLAVTVVASNGGTPPPSYRLIIDGTPGQSTTYSGFYLDAVSVGEHTYQVEYLGNADYPPSISAPVTVRVNKAPTTLSLTGSPGSVSRLGETDDYPFQIWVSSFYFAAGQVELYDGGTLIATETLTGSDAEFVVPLTLGRHVLTAKYLGNESYLPSKLTFEHTVVQNLPIALDATAVGNTIQVGWVASSPNLATTVLQRLVNGVWTNVASRGSHESTTYLEPNVAPGVLHTYRVQAFDWTPNLLATSPIDIAMVTAFTDDPLTPKVTRVKAAHLTQLVAAANTMRAAVGLAPISVPNAAPGKPIKSADVLAIRGAIQNARALLGLSNYPFTNILAPGAPVRAVDVQEMRNAVR